MKGGVAAVAFAAICCGGLPLLLALSAAGGTAGVIGGGVAFAVVLGIGLAVILVRGARRRKAMISRASSPIRRRQG